LRDLGVAQDWPQRAEIELERGCGTRDRPGYLTAHGAVSGTATAPSLAVLNVNAYTERKSTSRATNTWMRSPWALVTVGGILMVERRTSVMTSVEVEGLMTSEPLLLREFTAPCTAPLMTVSRIAAPNRSQKCRLTSPESPERPSSSVPGELRGTTTPVGVRASVQSTKSRELPCWTSPRVSPTSFVPRSRSTTVPSALNVSVAVMHVVIPGSVESIAVSSVQSMNAPFARRKRRVGSTEAACVGVTVGLRSAVSPCPPAGVRASVAEAPAASGSRPRPLTPGAPTLGDDDAENAGPASLRSSASSAGDFWAAPPYAVGAAIGAEPVEIGTTAGSAGNGG